MRPNPYRPLTGFSPTGASATYRVIPIGDGLGRVIADIIAHVRRFYGTPSVPACDNWDVHEHRPLPCAPYLLPGAQHHSVIKAEQIRTFHEVRTDGSQFGPLGCYVEPAPG